MTIKTINVNNRIRKKARNENIGEFLLRLDIACILEELREEYLDRYEGVTSEILNTSRFDEKFRYKYNLSRKITYDSRGQFDDRREVYNNRTRV